jgi:hypothetical protein
VAGRVEQVHAVFGEAELRVKGDIRQAEPYVSGAVTPVLLQHFIPPGCNLLTAQGV